MAQVVLGVLQSNVILEESDMGDIEYLSIKEFDGKLQSDLSTEFTATTTDVIDFTVPASKTYYIAEFRLIPITGLIPTSVNQGTVLRQCIAELFFDSTVKDVATYYALRNEAASGSLVGGSGQISTPFGITKGQSAAAGTVISVDVRNVSGTFRVSLIGFEEDADVSPAI